MGHNFALWWIFFVTGVEISVWIQPKCFLSSHFSILIWRIFRAGDWLAIFLIHLLICINKLNAFGRLFDSQQEESFLLRHHISLVPILTTAERHSLIFSPTVFQSPTLTLRSNIICVYVYLIVTHFLKI